MPREIGPRAASTRANPEHWQDFASCRGVDPEAFFDKSPIYAKSVCKDCPVKSECLADALRTNERYGVWGGLTWNERRKILRARAGAVTRQNVARRVERNEQAS